MEWVTSRVAHGFIGHSGDPRTCAGHAKPLHVCIAPLPTQCARAYCHRTLKIALVILHADPARGGAERYTIDLASALRARGQDVTLIASSFPVDPVPADSVHLDIGRGTRLGKYLRFLAQLDRHLDQARYD